MSTTTPFCRCGDCLNSSIPPNTDPFCGWRRCSQGKGGGFARALHVCAEYVPLNPDQDAATLLARRIYRDLRAGSVSGNRRLLRDQVGATDPEIDAAIKASKGHLTLAPTGLITPVSIPRTAP